MDQNSNYSPFTDVPESPYEKPLSYGYATASLVLGIIGVVFATCCCCLYYVSGILGILAIVFAILSRKHTGDKLCGKAIAGIILGAIAIVLCIALILISSIFGAMFEDLIAETENMTDAERQAYIEKYIYEYFGIDPDDMTTGNVVTIPSLN